MAHNLFEVMLFPGYTFSYTGRVLFQNAEWFFLTYLHKASIASLSRKSCSRLTRAMSIGKRRSAGIEQMESKWFLFPAVNYFRTTSSLQLRSPECQWLSHAIISKVRDASLSCTSLWHAALTTESSCAKWRKNEQSRDKTTGEGKRQMQAPYPTSETWTHSG